MTREQFISHIESTQRAFRRFLVALCCGDTPLADDIAQESLIKAYLASDGFKSTEKFKAWLYRIGYNTFLNHKRSVKLSTGYEDIAGISSEYKSDEGFRYQELYMALNNLPEKERTAVLLFYLEGYSIKEISEIVESTQDAVKQQLSRGRAHLRSKLNKD